MKRLLATLTLLLIVPLAQAGPNPTDISGDGPWYNPAFNPWGDHGAPVPTPPAPSLADSELGCILRLTIAGLTPAQSVVVNFAKNPLLFVMGAGGSLNATMIAGGLVRTLSLPPLDGAAGGIHGNYDFKALLTPVTLAVMRAGTQPQLKPDVPFNPKDVVSGTLNVWGLVQSTQEIAAKPGVLVTNPSGVQKPAGATVTAVRDCVTTALAPITKLLAIDPDDNLVLGTLQQYTQQVPTADSIATTASSIKSMLDTKTLTDLDLNHLLGALATATQKVGSLDTASLGANLANLGYATRTVSLPNPDPRTILDTASKQLILVDGGLGKIVLLSDPTSMVADNNLITALKGSASTAPTSFTYVNSLGDTKRTVGSLQFDSTLGNYRETLSKVDELAKVGIDTSIIPAAGDCKSSLNAAHTGSLFCVNPGIDEISPGKAAVLYNVLKAGGGLGHTPELPLDGNLVGTDKGFLKNLPPPGIETGKLNGVAALSPDFQGFGKWRMPSEGIGAIPGIDGPNTAALKDVGCKGSCLPDHDLNVLDGVFEGFQAPAMPNVASIVPLSAAQSVVAALMSAEGTVLSTVPLDVLQKAPIGAMSQLTLRAVGGSSTGALSQGIKDVAVQVDYADLFGISKSSWTGTTNTNGYATATISALATYTVTLTKKGYQPTTGTGQAPAPGAKNGQEYTMESASGNQSLDWFKNHAGESALTILLVVMVGFLVLRRVQDDRKDPTRRAQKEEKQRTKQARQARQFRGGAP